MRSPSSLRTKRISSFIKFRLLPPKDFFDSIDPQRKSQGASSSSACEGTAMAIRLARELRTILPSGTLAWRLGLWLFRGKRPGRIALGSADT